MVRDTRTHARAITLALLASAALCAFVRGDESADLRTALRHALEYAETNSASTGPKLFQRTNVGTPPLPPHQFNPDAGVRLTPNWVEDVAIAYELRRQTNRIEPEPPPQFNPDPGASLKPPIEAPKPFFQYDYVPLPVFSGEPIPNELRLARTNTTQTELLLREPETPPPAYGWQPLTDGLVLPRTNVVENLPIPAHWRVQRLSTG